jgi:hypothetical protein
MDRWTVVRRFTFGALVTGLVPLAGLGVHAAGAGESSAALCHSTFGDGGPTGDRVVGEGPIGDPMSATLGWDPADFRDGLREIVTCVSVDGHLVPALTTSSPTPFNDGSLALNLTLPAGQPGSLVCQQSILLGAGQAAGARPKTTGPVCFKLRAAEPPLQPGGLGANSPGSPAPAPPGAAHAGVTPGSNASAGRVPVGPPVPGRRPQAPGTPYPGSTPPARAAFEAARGGVAIPVLRPPLPAPKAVAPAAAPVRASAAAPAAAAAPAGAGRRSTTAAPGAAAARVAHGNAAGTAAAAPGTTTLARTGIDNHIPLAGGGGFLALGGAAIIFGTPRRRKPARISG